MAGLAISMEATCFGRASVRDKQTNLHKLVLTVFPRRVPKLSSDGPNFTAPLSFITLVPRSKCPRLPDLEVEFSGGNLLSNKGENSELFLFSLQTSAKSSRPECIPGRPAARQPSQPILLVPGSRVHAALWSLLWGARCTLKPASMNVSNACR